MEQKSKINANMDNFNMYGGQVAIYGYVNRLYIYGGVACNYGIINHQNVTCRDNGKVVYREKDESAHLRDLLDVALEVNHQQALRIKELEEIIKNNKEAQTPIPWDVRPTRAECERLIKQFDIFREEIIDE